MTLRYTSLYESIAKVYANTRPKQTVAPVPDFPFPTMYQGQKDILAKINPNDSFCLTSHTGFGKTAVFLTITRRKASIVIEPRKYLQEQVSAGYFHDFVLYGRSGYQCKYAETAATAPCMVKEDCDEAKYHAECKEAKKRCCVDKVPCETFETRDGCKAYPCDDCKYIAATRDAISNLVAGKTVICNFGNFWNILKKAEIVVVDEADLFFRTISAPIRLKYSNPKKHGNDDIRTLLLRETDGLHKDMKSAISSFKYTVRNALYNAEFFLKNYDLCFTYARKDRIYIEIDPRNTNILAEKLFKGKQVVIVSATPGSFKYPAYSAEIHQRCGIFFAPVGNLTSRSLKQNPYLLSSAAKAITEISTYMDLCYDADRVVIHCGNIGTHATGMYGILGEENCVLHHAGKLAETIDEYLQSSKKYLLVAAAEYGGDFGWCKLQFILKFPYPNMDERMQTLKRMMGPEFSAYYENEARVRAIQMTGRNVRGYDDFGVTISLDSKIYDDYVRNMDKYPDWYKNRIDTRCY